MEQSRGIVRIKRVAIHIFVFLWIALAATPAVLAEPSPAGTLHVISAPGQRVYVDGKFAGLTISDPAGLEVRGLSTGEHRVLIVTRGFRSKRFVVTIQPGTDVEVNVGKLQVRRRIRRKPREEPVDMTVGSPPMKIDDTATPGDANWEINILLDADLSRDSDTHELPVLDINYGVGENVQLKYEVPYVFSRDVQTDEAGNEHTVRDHGLGHSTIGVKYRFYDNDETNLSLAVYPQVEFRSPGGLAGEGTTWMLPVLLTKDFEHESITANANIEKTTGDPHAHVFAGFGVGTRLGDKLALLGEVVGQQLESSADHRVLLDVGLRFKIDEKQAFVGAVGLDFEAGDGQRHHYATVGYQRFIGK